MINSFTTYFKYISRTLFTVTSIVLMFNISIAFAQQELSAFSYVNKKISQSISEPNELTSGQADSANVSEDEGIETWSIALNDQISSLNQGDTLQVPLPSGQIISASITTRKEFKNGDVQLVAGSKSGNRIILTIGSSVAFGSISNFSNKVNFSISFDGKDQVLIDQDTLPADAVDFNDDMVEPDLGSGELPQTLEDSAQAAEATTSETDGKTNIDVLFVYSSEFGDLFGSAETRINQLIAFTNQAYDDTGVLINLRMAAAIELDIVDSDTVSDSLNDARFSREGTGFDNVSVLRNQTGADLVAVLTTSPTSGSNGIANVGGNNQGSAFSSTKLSARCCDIVFAHEIGHNLGSRHQRAELLLPQNSDISPCTGGFTGFSCGHSVNEVVNGVERTNWSTIMASGRSINRRNIFSNLTLDCDGDPCGIAQGEVGAADNLTSFNLTRTAISQYRDEIVPEPEPEPEPGDSLLLDVVPLIIRGAQQSN